MFLKKVELFGFKSFADRVTLEFSDGIISLLGPNGCGKSNIVDSIKWVLGEQSIKTLRAGQMDDVIFNGSESRKPLNVAEVALTIANDTGYLQIDLPEIELKRRIYRGGENEYLINNTPVRLKEIRELFYDTGIGKSSYSILEQGKIDQILSHRPEDRRYIFEEAAGITRFKQKSAEAERKLVKTDENIRQVENILREVRKTYESRKVQAEKAAQSKKLQESIFEIEVEVQLSRIKELKQKHNEKFDEFVIIAKQHTEIKEYIDKTNLELEENLDEINTMSRERIDMQTRMHRLDELKNSKVNQISLLTDRINDFEKSVAEAKDRGSNLKSHIERDENDIIYKVKARNDLFDEIEGIDHEIKTFETNVLTAEERIILNDEIIQTNEQIIIQEEKKQSVYRDELLVLTDAIVVELDKKLKESRYSYKERRDLELEIKNHTKNLIMRLSGKSQITNDFIKTLSDTSESVEKYLKNLLSSIESTVGEVQILDKLFSSYIEMTPSFLDEFLSPEGIITRKRNNDDALTKSLDTVKTYNNEIRELREENRNLNQKLSQYRQTLENLKVSQADMKGRADTLQSLVSNLKRSVQEQELLFEDSRKDIDVSLDRLTDTKERINQTKDELFATAEEEKALQLELHAVVNEIERKNNSVRARRESVNSKFGQLSTLTTRLERLKAEQDSLEHETTYIYDNFEDSYSRSLKEYDSKVFEIHDDIQQLRQKLKNNKLEMQNLGYINHMAAEEYLEVKERYEFLTRQLNDLDLAKSNLRQITDEITEKSEELFATCYTKLKVNFHAMFRRLFGGGRAELKLVDPDDMLHTGIDILAQPPGKKLEKISLLSGGERSLTAVALLFATYMVKPSPFCILDEIDAALDDANIAHFLDVLQEFSEKSQFIIITHNKKTVLGSKTLLGVTMEEAGVSKAISYRIQDIENEETTSVMD